jgi:hypothetical protein
MIYPARGCKTTRKNNNLQENLMKVKRVLIAVAFLIGGPAFAQTPSTDVPPKPPAHQPGVPARPATSTNQTQAPAAPEEKIDPAKEAAIRHLMDLTQTSKLGEELNAYVAKQVRDALSEALPADRLAKFMQGFSEKMEAAAPASAITDATVSAYARAFSMEDIQGLVQFYESPLGQRVVKTLPQVAQETQRTGVQMQQKGAMAVLQDMSNEYPELKSMLQPPQGNGAVETPRTEKAPAPASPPAAK